MAACEDVIGGKGAPRGTRAYALIILILHLHLKVYVQITYYKSQRLS